MKRSDYPIGIFDSGVGGLTVFKEMERVLPQENIVYFGDTARVPYGGKSKSTIIRFSTENILFLLKKRVKIVVVACNTSSSLALSYLKKVFAIPIIGVIKAGVDKAVAVSSAARIGVIGTRATIVSGSYQREILKIKREAKVYARPCPLFVPLVEEGIVRGEVVRGIVREYLKPLKGRIDTLILGCTHYPLLKGEIARYLKGVYLVDSARQVALRTKEILENNNLLNNTKKGTRHQFYVTDEPSQFQRMARIFLKHSIDKPSLVTV